ncbi:MAG: hypothetical protein JXB29_11680, partial [Sedimentisphaerales bacterium]|nr:hypothetical protein [Sedimentisphaerales bacterium]
TFRDTSDLLGWYEIVYEDGFVETIDLRYGYNIYNWDMVDKDGKVQFFVMNGQSPNCYAADAVDCSKSGDNTATFFAYEWVNPRFGKKIKEVNLKGTTKFVGSRGKLIPSNAIILLAVSAVDKRPYPGKGAQSATK